MSNSKRRTRLLLATAALAIVGLLLLRVAVRSLPGAGPWLADSLRALIGDRAVTYLEERSAELEDRWNRIRPSRRRPRSIAEVKREPQSSTPASDPSAAPPSSGPEVAPFRPRDVLPMNRSVSAPEDGIWRAVADPALPREPPLLFATLLHPDPKRSWAEVFVVAIDLPRVRVHAVAGSYEPVATTRDGKLYARAGVVPTEQRERLLAAFNGGFKTQHGRHGMVVDGVTLVEPRPALCSIVGYSTGALEIGTWRSFDANSGPEIEFVRQTPGCMVERGVLNPLLRDEQTKNWGATLDGNTVIRRSSVGLNAERTVLFVAVTNDTTARALADTMMHVGASDVAQLDVNWSYPKFLLFPRASNGTRYAQTLFDGFVFERDEYLGKPSPRDFFFVTRR